MRALCLVIACLGTTAAPASAHEFWIVADRFRIEPGQAANLVLQVGEGATAQRSELPARRVLRFESDASGALTPGLGGPNADARFVSEAPGGHVVMLLTDAAPVSAQPAAAFNAYLQAEGLTPAIAARAARGQSRQDGAEHYRRAAKILLQVGTGGDQGAVVAPIGAPLELVPEVSPYAQPRSSQLVLRVLWEGRALGGATVRLSPLSGGLEQMAVSDATGRVDFPTPNAGRWRATGVWTRDLGPGADPSFETTFASLSFGLD